MPVIFSMTKGGTRAFLLLYQQSPFEREHFYSLLEARALGAGHYCVISEQHPRQRHTSLPLYSESMGYLEDGVAKFLCSAVNVKL